MRLQLGGQGCSVRGEEGEVGTGGPPKEVYVDHLCQSCSSG